MGANVHDTSVDFSLTSNGTRTTAPTVALRALDQLEWSILGVVNSQAPKKEDKSDCKLLPPLHLQVPEIGNR